MGLQSALSTSLTGLNAAETSIDVAGNNVANSNTVGFKESSVNFATQFLETQSIGSAPTGNSGGTNPRQIGLGVKVAEIAPKFTQGTIQVSSNPLDLAIQGDGFFIVQGSQGQQLYTRNGQFKTNADNEIVTTSGQRVLGFGVNDNFEIQPTGLVPIHIPLGAAAVAQATQNVFMEGTLDPNGDVGSVPNIIQSQVLSDGSKEVPADTTTSSSLARPTESTTPMISATAGAVGIGTYSYKVTFVDPDGRESPASKVTSNVAVAAGGGSIDLSAIPQPVPGSGFTGVNVYRNDSTADNIYRKINATPITTTTLNDGASDASIAGNTQLNDSGLASGSYSYYVTFYNAATGEESRPAARIGPITADATNKPRIRLDNLPTPATTDFDGIKIYRNLANDSSAFHLVGTLTQAQLAASTDKSFVDSSPDASISGAAEVNLDGPSISFGLKLTDVTARTGSNYSQLFQPGVLSFTGSKGGHVLSDRDMTITNTTTVQDLLSFMDDALGVVKTAPEASFPTTPPPGGSITADSRLEFTSNMGIENALGIDLSSFQLTPTGGIKGSVPLGFTSTNADTVNGQGASTDFVVYDSLGTPLNVRLTTVLEKRDDTQAQFRWIATSPDNDPLTGFSTIVGTGLITTDGKGKFVSASNSTVDIDRVTSPADSPLEFKMDFSQISGLDQGTNELSASRQDGSAAGTLSSFIITDTGKVSGVFSNGTSRDLGQIRMARFANNAGLEQIGDNVFSAGVNSGLPIQGNPGSQGIGNVTAGAVELSNTDIGQNLIELILASTQYRGGARVITAVQQLFDELLNLRR